MSTNINRNLKELCQNLYLVYCAQKVALLYMSVVRVLGGTEPICRWIKLVDRKVYRVGDGQGHHVQSCRLYTEQLQEAPFSLRMMWKAPAGAA